MVSTLLYDLLYRIGAPWDGPPRAELVALVESGVLAPDRLAPGRAIDLGCGGGSNAVYLARHGFETVGVDFSRQALKIAANRVLEAGVQDRVRLVRADLTAGALPGVSGAFDLLVDYGTLDDLRAGGRAAMARLITNLARPGSRFVFWCFYGRRNDLPRISLTRPSRMTLVIEEGEEDRLFGADWEIARLPPPAPAPGSGAACFLLTRRAGP